MTFGIKYKMSLIIKQVEKTSIHDNIPYTCNGTILFTIKNVVVYICGVRHTRSGWSLEM